MPPLKLINIVGARPQFIKASAISRAIRLHFSDRITEKIIHTGQHYDKELSDIFFDELEMHNPKICLTGDIMYNNVVFFSELAENHHDVRKILIS